MHTYRWEFTHQPETLKKCKSDYMPSWLQILKGPSSTLRAKSKHLILGSQACIVCVPDLQENSLYSFNRPTLFHFRFALHVSCLKFSPSASNTHSLLGPSWQDWILFEVQPQHKNDGVSFQPDFLEPFHWTLLSSHPNLLCLMCVPNSIYHCWISIITFNFLHLFFASFQEKHGRRETAETRAKKPGHKVVTQ